MSFNKYQPVFLRGNEQEQKELLKCITEPTTRKVIRDIERAIGTISMEDDLEADLILTWGAKAFLIKEDQHSIWQHLEGHDKVVKKKFKGNKMELSIKNSNKNEKNKALFITFVGANLFNTPIFPRDSFESVEELTQRMNNIANM